MTIKQLVVIAIISFLFSILGVVAVFFWIIKPEHYFGQKAVLETIKHKESLIEVQNAVIDSIEKTSPSVVNIMISKNLVFYLNDPMGAFGQGSVISEKRANIGWGSWILISKKWYILTNKHVISDLDADYSVILKDGTTYKVDKIRVDPLIDLAVIRIVDSKNRQPDNLPIAPIASIDQKVRIGQFVVAIWNALGEYQNSANFGIISGRNRSLDSWQKNLYIWLYQTDTPINPGNSWGPLVDLAGNVIWITTAINAYANSIWFALPISKEFVTTLLDTIETEQKIVKPFIGIQYSDLDKKIAQELKISSETGVYVQQVIPSTPWAVAGLLSWDVILSINDRLINQDLPFLYQLSLYKPGETVSLTILRNETEKKLSLELGKLQH